MFAANRCARPNAAMPEIDDDDIANAMLAIAVANRRLWPAQTRWEHRGERPLNATQKQTLMMLSGLHPELGRDEIARRLYVDETAVHHAMRELLRRRLVMSHGRHPVDHRRKVQNVTPAGHVVFLDMLVEARPVMEDLVRQGEKTGRLWL